MNAVAILILVSSVWPTISAALRHPPNDRSAHSVMSPRREAIYMQLFRGPVDPFALSAPDLGLDPEELHSLFRNTDRWLDAPTVSKRSVQQTIFETETWTAEGFREDDIRRSLGRQFDLEWAKIQSKVVLIDPNANPYVPIRRSGWQTDDSLKLPVAGSLFVVGQLRTNSASIEQQQYEFIGRTGVGMRLPDWLGGEIQLRGGRSKANYDTDTESMFPGKVTTFLELATKVPLTGRLNLEYTGKAIPAPTSADHDILKQEVKLAFPFSDSSQFNIGARYKWEDSASTPWQDRMNLFIGLQMKR